MKQYYAVKCTQGKQSILLPNTNGIYATTNKEAIKEFVDKLKKEVKFIKYEIVSLGVL